MSDANAIASSIADAVSNTLSPDASQRHNAETFLSQREADTVEFPLIVLRLVANAAVADHVRQASAILLKNVTARAYNTSSTPGGGGGDDVSSVAPGGSSAAAYSQVKAALVDVMLSCPAPIRRPLGNVLSCIAEQDHPAQWPQLVSSLTADRLEPLIKAAVAKCGGETSATHIAPFVDWLSVTAILETLLSIFDRYPERMRSDELFSEINHSLHNSQQHVLSLFQLLVRVFEEDLAGKDPQLVHAVLSTTDVLCRVFYCLSWQDLPAFFEDNLAQYMGALRKLLIFSSATVDALTDDEAGPLDAVHASVLEIANLYATKYDEEFRQFLPQYMSDAWELLMRRGNASRYDLVVTTGIKFLSSIARSPDAHLFNDPSALEGVCNRIVVPNIQLRDEDAEMFEDDPREYVRHDLEGSDTGTRRRGAVELVKALCVRYEKPVTQIFSSYVQSIFSPETDWRARDTAIYLVIALGWKSGTLMRGVTETSSLIDISHFFQTFVSKELIDAANQAKALSSPILTADLIKFVIAFRHQISVDGCKVAMQSCSRLLAANEPVVRTYAAACVERILTMRHNDAAPKANGNGAVADPKLNSAVRGAGGVGVAALAVSTKLEYRISKADVVPLLPEMLPLIVAVLKQTARPDEYIMRLLLRLCSFCRDGMGPHIESVLPPLVDLLVAATANPANPLFNHYLFETFAALIRFNGNPNTVAVFEAALMTPLCNVLITDVTEFGPYVFQILAQMLNVRALSPEQQQQQQQQSATSTVPDQYTGIMNPTLNPAMWDRRAYIAAMVQYIEAYLGAATTRLVADKQLEPTLGVFQKLIASKATDHHGLHLLTRIFERLDLATLSPYVQTILSALMLRLNRARTAKYVNHLVVVLSTFIVRFGAGAFRTAFDGVQKDLLAMLLKQVWLPDVVKIRDDGQRRICAFGLAELSCGPPEMCASDPTYRALWADIVTANIALVEGIVVDDNGAADREREALEEEEAEEVGVLVGAAETYASSQSFLRWGVATSPIAITTGSNIPLLKQDPRAVLFVKVSAFVDRHKAQFEPLLQQAVNPDARKALLSYQTLPKPSVVSV